MERLVGKLPESLQVPIIREIHPLKALFLHQRPPRILLLGDRAASRSALVNALFSRGVAEATEDHLQDGTWQLFGGKTGRLSVLDARRPISLGTLRRALAAETPDVCLYLHAEPLRDEDGLADVQHAAEVLRAVLANRADLKVQVIGVVAQNAAGGDPETARRHLDRLLYSTAEPIVRDRVAGLYSLQLGPAEIARLARALVNEMPEETRLELVRLAGVRDVQRELAQSVVRSVSAISGAVGAQPIPLADFPIITSLQAAMVAGIMHITGEELSLKQAGKWIAALGANIGIGLVLREGARAALKLVPIWGDLVSGGVAAAGTYAIGRAAIAYFIDGVTLASAKEMFAKSKKTKPPELTEG
jgi:uncharacterized protein (DUF697 family)